jgi:hypothetical protein
MRLQCSTSPLHGSEDADLLVLPLGQAVEPAAATAGAEMQHAQYDERQLQQHAGHMRNGHKRASEALLLLSL